MSPFTEETLKEAKAAGRKRLAAKEGEMTEPRLTDPAKDDLTDIWLLIAENREEHHARTRRTRGLHRDGKRAAKS